MKRDAGDDARVAEALFSAFRGGGYAVSMRSLTEATGLKSASLYHRFADGKAQMADAALHHATVLFQADVVTPLTGPGTPDERLQHAAEGLQRFYADGSHACLLGVLALSDAPANVRRTVRGVFEAFVAKLANAYRDAGIDDPIGRAEDAIAGLQGALILRQAGVETSAFARAVASFAKP